MRQNIPPSVRVDRAMCWNGAAGAGRTLSQCQSGEGRLGSSCISQNALYIRTVSHHDSTLELTMTERVLRIKRVYR